MTLPRRVGRVYFHGSREQKQIALTFDDVPSKNTEKLLEFLNKHKIKGCFFIQGNLAVKRKKTISKIKKQGHEIGNHNFSHLLGFFKSKKFIEKEISKVEELIGKTRFVRPPYLHVGLNYYLVCKKKDKKIICCDVVPDDWKLGGIDKPVNSILKNVRGGSIINFHDYVTGKGVNIYLLEILKRVVPELSRRGFKFVRVSDLIC